ncbi:acyl carrier protein [Acetobacter oeni]|uniref:Carrier domain-containing protein n=1 Tax=Acetobacter oeni TaxID=304077 RepID=A0A511XI11_9PROT|nr:acyl carrier protein [Acetobacter oeni]MBB3882991.1 acyl carrier protein [Acetobacter oeni]NHO19067.1 acyl carrier protein [Acetobacter oeni]GBR11728.1 hypothetical protein AA21952_3443 [Acetobacter oeni LMG 21952]GEN62575.1 hypothetical protein AOE01nite_07990 [Acetobacter oeni]
MAIAPDRIRRRLTRVFTTMFPGKTVEDVPAATMENTDGWDSLGTLSLFTLADEEFGIKLGLDRIGDVKSFEKLEALVTEKVG